MTNLSPNRHAWYSPVKQFALSETKHTRHHRNMKRSLLVNPFEPELSPESRRLGGFMSVRGGFTFVQAGLTFKFDKNPTNVYCFIFQFGGAWSFV